jgi:undecaprenyl-diphosphatase
VKRRSWAVLAQVGATLGLAFGFGLVAAQLYAEPRPFTTHHDIRLLVSHAPGQSFPSDHATAAFAMALALLVFVSKAWGRLLLAMAVLIGFARVYTGVHYLGDILGSLAVVLLALAVVELASTAIRRRGPGRRTRLISTP